MSNLTRKVHKVHHANIAIYGKNIANTEKQAGAELGQAQPQLGFWELISFSFKVEN